MPTEQDRCEATTQLNGNLVRCKREKNHPGAHVAELNGQHIAWPSKPA